MGKREKEHRKKVRARNDRVNQEKNKIQKIKQDFLMELIRKEKEKGMFENNPVINPIDVPISDPTIEGPSI